jgi:MinD superfamily P-loop ATPase
MSSITIAIASGKGGTGKTLVATNLFHALQVAGKTVNLSDCDAEEPNALAFFNGEKSESFKVTQKVPVIDQDKCVYCEKCHEYCNYKAIFMVPSLKIIRVMDELCHSCGACLVACEYDAITEKDVELGKISDYSISETAKLVEARVKTGTMSPVKVIQSAIKHATQNKENDAIVILDAPPGTSCPFIHTVNAADFTVLVTEPTPFGLSNLKQAVDTLKTMHKPYGVIINRSGLGDEKIYQYLQEEQIPLLLEIPYNRQIAVQYSTGKLITAENPDFAESFIQLFNYIENNYGNSHHKR